MPRKTKTPGRMPNYDLKVLNKKTDKVSYVGAGWLQEDGSISISLDLCVVLKHDPNLVITLFPADPNRGKKEATDAVS